LEKINIHVYPNNILNESRIGKITRTISGLNKFHRILIIGIWEKGLKEIEPLTPDVFIIRKKLFTNVWLHSSNFRILKIIEFIFRVFFDYAFKNVKMINIHVLALLPIGVVFKIFKRSILIYDTHELETERHAWSKYRRFVSKVLEKSCMHFVDEIFVVSDSIGLWYAKKYDVAPITILNCPKYKRVAKSDIFRNRFNISASTKIFLYQGSLSAGRGIEIIIEAFSELLDKNYVLIFLGYGYLVDQIIEAAHKYSNIYYHPAVPPSSLFGYTSSADIGISLGENTCLSYYYSLPNKVFEYTSAGLPVLVSDFPEMKKLVKNHKIGTIVKNNNKEQIKNAIVEILRIKEKDLLKNLNNFAKLYNWENQEKSLINTYLKIIKN